MNPCFLAISKLITSLVIPLSNNTFTVSSFWVSILSSSIFTITFLNMFLLFRPLQDILSITLKSITNLFVLLRSNWELSDLCPHLNYFVHFSPWLFFSFYYSHFLYILAFCLFQIYLLFSCFYSILLCNQISCNFIYLIYLYSI